MGNSNLRGADEDILSAILGVKRGCVNLFSVVNDKDKKVQILLDKKIYNHLEVGFHPMQNTSTTSIASADIDNMLEKFGKTADIIDFDTLEATVAAKQPAKGTKAAKGGKKEE